MKGIQFLSLLTLLSSYTIFCMEDQAEKIKEEIKADMRFYEIMHETHQPPYQELVARLAAIALSKQSNVASVAQEEKKD